jgi:flagellar assembly factor FliW
MVSNFTQGVTATVAQVTVETLVSGSIEVGEDQIIQFIDPLLGFEHCTSFVLYQTKPGPLFWLQSCEDKQVSFALLTPFDVGLDPDYPINASDLAELGASDVDKVTVYTMVTLADYPKQTVTNLRAPVLVAGNKAMQLVFDDESLDLRFPLVSLVPGHK